LLVMHLQRIKTYGLVPIQLNVGLQK
jgi:hypothetical protein